jgi:hypothetical protein
MSQEPFASIVQAGNLIENTWYFSYHSETQHLIDYINENPYKSQHLTCDDYDILIKFTNRNSGYFGSQKYKENLEILLDKYNSKQLTIKNFVERGNFEKHII